MKSLLSVLVCICACFHGFAQTSDAEAEAIINLLGVQMKQAVDQLVAVSGKDSAAFWKLYGEYEAKNKPTMKTRLRVYERTAKSYGRMTPAAADSLANLYFINRREQEMSLEDYYKKIKAATNAVVAFEFYQAETYLITQMRAQIMQQIPPYGAVQKAAMKNLR